MDNKENLRTPDKKRKNEEIGYVHVHVTPKKTSKKGNDWYQFLLQASPTNSMTIAGLDLKRYNKICNFKETKSPVKVIFDDERKEIFTKQIEIIPLQAYDIDFRYVDKKEEGCSMTKLVLIGDIPSMDYNTYMKISVKGRVYMGKESPRDVNTRYGPSKVKEFASLKMNLEM